MKTLMIIMLGIAIAFSQQACAHKTNVPKNVAKAFTQKFPTAKSVKWDKENKTEWEVEFKLNGEEYSANFSTDGKWKETEHKIDKSVIPANVKQTLDKEFAGYDIEESEISETADGKVYEFALEKDETDMEVAISLDGKVIKKEVKKKDEEDND